MKRTMTHSRPFRSGRASTAFLMVFALVACLLFAVPGEALAAPSKPTWVETKIVSWKIVRNKNVTSQNDSGYYAVEVKIRHRNTSTDKIIKSFYDKVGTVTVKTSITQLTGALRSTKVNRVSMDPGQSFDLLYTLPLTSRDGGNTHWSIINSELGKKIESKSNKVTKWTYDLKVKWEGI